MADLSSDDFGELRRWGFARYYPKSARGLAHSKTLRVALSVQYELFTWTAIVQPPLAGFKSKNQIVSIGKALRTKMNADYKSAIQQDEILRYENWGRGGTPKDFASRRVPPKER